MKTTSYHIMAKAAGAACNLRCDYCYYLEKQSLSPSGQHRRVRPEMSDAVLERYIQSYIQSQPHDAPVVFTWHGGEALLRPIAFYRQALELQRRYADGRKIENTLQTNGILMSEDWCRFFRQHSFLIGISLDGNEAQHDRYRRTIGGQGSFARVMRAIEMMRRMGVEYNILSTINRFNADDALVYYDFMRSIGAQFIQFSPIVERVRLGAGRYTHVEAPYIHANAMQRELHDGNDISLAPYSVTPEQWGDFLCTLFDEWVRHDVGEIFIQIFDATLAGWMGVTPGVCTLAPTCGHAGIVEHTGAVYSCDHYVYPRYQLGNILTDDLSTLMQSHEQIRFGQAKQEGLTRQCLGCRYRFACHGECPKNRFALSRDGEPGHNYLCAGYYQYFDHVKPYMDYMARCLSMHQPPSLIMGALRSGRLGL